LHLLFSRLLPCPALLFSCPSGPRDPPDLHFSLHDALPILPPHTHALDRRERRRRLPPRNAQSPRQPQAALHRGPTLPGRRGVDRDRKSTRPELQSRFDLVCRLLLEKKNTNTHCNSNTTNQL